MATDVALSEVVGVIDSDKTLSTTVHADVGDNVDDANPSAKLKSNGPFKKSRLSGKTRKKRKNERKLETSGATKDDEGAPYHWLKNKRRKVDIPNAGPSYMNIPFTADEIAAEERRPKRRVAVMIGYAGTDYHGLQINHAHRTIEGDLFKAFVEAGAISKANANDPLKSKLVRCARTDRGVHAAGNVLSLNLIIEDVDLVDKLNARLPSQIRVWGVHRTNKKFSSHQACDSRWYEYLMPSYALLPPHPYSYLSEKITETAEENGVAAEYRDRLGDTGDFWKAVEQKEVRPILNSLPPAVREAVLATLHSEGSVVDGSEDGQDDNEQLAEPANKVASETPAESKLTSDAEPDGNSHDEIRDTTDLPIPAEKQQNELNPVEVAIRDVKIAWMKAKRRYRTSPDRMKHLQTILDLFVGTNNFHNYTVQRAYKDPSSYRHIKSFVVDPKPILKGDTEWLSLKVHGQSFMMHQIRKMVAMAALIVRTGARSDVIRQSFGPRRISIPKAPGLGLLLERPVFENYNARAAENFQKDAIDFEKYERQIREFKDREIYQRMWETEERANTFNIFFSQIDNFRTDYFLWCTPAGIEASYERAARGAAGKVPKGLKAELGEEDDEDVDEADVGDGEG